MRKKYLPKFDLWIFDWVVSSIKVKKMPAVGAKQASVRVKQVFSINSIRDPPDLDDFVSSGNEFCFTILLIMKQKHCFET
jgi:hypothetical protein